MATTSVAASVTEATSAVEGVTVRALIRDRRERGLLFYEEHGAEFVEISPTIVRVPSRSGDGFHDVDPEREECPCPDYECRTSKHGVGCAHVYGVAIARARARARRRSFSCEGCGDRFPDRERVEVMDEHLTFFVGDPLCRDCALHHGVL